jgi:adhesin transport system membrane fusion protein
MKLHNNRDTDFMAELEAATRLRPATSVVLMLFSVVALGILFIVWAAVSKVEVITRGQGQVVPTREIQVVQSLEGGILAELLVKEGEQVSKDQILMRLNNSQFSSDEKEKEAKFLSLTAKKARLEAEANGTEFVVPPEVAEKGPKIAANEKALYESRQRELKNAYSIVEDKINGASAGLSSAMADIARFTENRRLLQQELEITRKMVEQRAAPKLEQMQKERELSDLSGQINAASERQKGLEAELQEAKRQKETQEGAFRSQALSELNETESEIAGLQENLKSAGDRVNRGEIKSPVEGIVNNIALTTIGGVVEPAMRLVEIVPLDDELKIVARVAPNEVAFLKPGQDVKVKITAYDPQKYGALHGKLVRIGANSVTDREGNISFEIEVRTDKNHMGTDENPLPITPGMVANTEVITGKRTILEYMLKPILRAQDVALTEH